MVLLEARDRVGGRLYTKTVEVDGHEVSTDLGGAYIGRNQVRIACVCVCVCWCVFHLMGPDGPMAPILAAAAAAYILICVLSALPHAARSG